MKKPIPHKNSSLKCKQCHWYWHVNDDTGETCKASRNVKKNSRACIEFEKVDFAPHIVRHTDSFIRDIRKRVQGEKFNVDTSIVDELNMYTVFAKYDPSKKKIVRRVPSSFDTTAMQKLVKLLEETQAKKDRVSEIKISFMGLEAGLLAIKSTCESYIYDYYITEFNAVKNETARTAFLRAIFKEVYEKLELVQYILSVAEVTDKNLTNSYFSLREISQLSIAFSKMD